MKQPLSVAALLLCITIAHAQFKVEYIDLKIKTNRDMPLRFFYKNVMVLDNRVDSNICIIQDGKTPPAVMRFNGTAAGAIENYIKGRTGHLEKNSETLLLNITEIRVPNKTFLKTMSKRSNRHGWERVRNALYLSADAYAGNDGHYRRLYSIRQNQYPYAAVKDAVRDALDDLVELTEQVALDGAGKRGRVTKAYKQFLKDSTCFTLYNDTTVFTIPQISISKREEWKNCNILKQETPPVSRIFPLFSDFKNNNSLRAALQISFNEANATYEIKVLKGDSAVKTIYPWAVADSSCWYIRIFKTGYLKMIKQQAGFYFTVPDSLPDMYQLLCEEYISSGGISAGVVGGGVMSKFMYPDIIADGIVNLFELIGRHKKLGRIAKNPYSSAFRHCYVNMDSGDIMYGADD